MTLVEVVVAFVVLGILLSLAAMNFNSITTGVSEEAASVRLGVVQVAARQISAAKGEYPSTLSTDVRPAGTTVVGGATAVSGADQVSLHWVDSVTTVLAAEGEEGICVFLFDSLEAPTMWGVDRNPSAAGCSASAATSFHPALNASSVVSSRDAVDPTPIDVP